MPKKQSSDKRTHHPIATALQKKSKSQRKRSNHKRAIAPAPQNRPAPNLKREEHKHSSDLAMPLRRENGHLPSSLMEPELKLDIISAESEPAANGKSAKPQHEPALLITETPEDKLPDPREVKDSTFPHAPLDPDAFLLEDESEDISFSNSSLTAPLSGFELDTFLLEDTGNELSPQVEQSNSPSVGADLSRPSPIQRPSEDPKEPLPPADNVITQDEVVTTGDQEVAPTSSQPHSTTQTSTPTDTDSHPISDLDEEKPSVPATHSMNDFDEEHSSGTLLIASPSAPEDTANTPQSVLIDENGSSDIAVLEQDLLPQIIDTPLPATAEEDELHEAPYSLKEWYPEGVPLPHILDTPLPSFEKNFWYERKPLQVLRKVAALFLLLLLIVSSILLWRDLTDTHLFVYTLDPATGTVLAQQDLGGGYQGKTTITDPVQVRSTLVVGVRAAQTPNQPNQQVLTLSGQGMSWHLDNKFAAPLTSGTLSTTADGHLVVENANGLQVMTSNDHLLWSMQGDQPALGAHAFQPVSGNQTLYTVKSARLGQIAAFDQANGAIHWIVTLNDTFNYSPPLLLNAGILYIAGDHNLYALNSVDGSLLWQKQWASRSLLVLNNGQASFLVAGGAQGLAAYASTTGTPIWSFNGQPGNKAPGLLTAAQFYQAGIDSANNVIYATGIVWDALQVREQLWLYAVDGTTGTLRWSEPIGFDFTSADAGRIFTPLVAPIYGLVAVEQVQDNGIFSISAFDSSTGASRWNMHFDGETAASSVLLQASSDALLHFKIPRGKKHLLAAAANIPDTILILPITQSSVPTVLSSWSHLRILFMILILFSLFGLLLLWMLPLHVWIVNQQDHIHNLRHNVKRYPLYPLKLVLRFRRYSPRLFALVILLLLISAVVLEYVHLNQPENGLYAIAGSTGNIQWQRINASSTQAMLADTQVSIANVASGDHLHQLSGLDRNGAVQWTTFASEGVFSIPSVPTRPATILLALSGPTTLNYQFASEDPAYQHLQEHILDLYLLNRETGQILWQSNIVRPDQQQDAVVLGADANFIYVASRQTNTGVHSQGVQLIAVNTSTGNIEWRIFGPQEDINAPLDDGSLLLPGRLIYWQVAGTIYSIDTTLGQIQWRRSIIDDDPYALLTEEAQMAEAAGVLLVERSSVYHVLDAASGNELQSFSNPNTGTSQSLAGIIAVDNTFLVYGDSTIEAVNAATQQIIWKQDNFDAIQNLKVSDDKKTVYIVQLNSVDQSLPTPVQALTALDIKTGSVRWTFQPSAQASFVNPHSEGLQYSKGILFATLCMPDAQSSCARQRLYAIDAATGNALWKFEAQSIFNLHVSPDGSTVLLQTHSTAWINLIGRFRS